MSNHISWENRGGMMALTTMVLVLVERTCSTQAEKDAVLNDFKEAIETTTNKLMDSSGPPPTNTIVKWEEREDFVAGLVKFSDVVERNLRKGFIKDSETPIEFDF